LLKLVRHNRRIRHTSGTHCKSLLTVPDCVGEDLFRTSDTHRRDTNTSTQETICHLEEPLASLWDVTNKLTFFVHISKPVKHVDAGNLNLVELESSIVNSVETNLESHIFDENTLARLHVSIPNWHDESVDSFILSLDMSLGKDNSVVGVAGTVCDPELLRKRGWTIDRELLCRVVIMGCSFHLGSIVSKAKLCEAETSHVFEAVNLSHEI